MRTQQCVCGDCAEARGHISKVGGEFTEMYALHTITKAAEEAGLYEGDECELDHNHAKSKSCSLVFMCDECGDKHDDLDSAVECCEKWECNFCGYVHGSSFWGGSAMENAAQCCAQSCDDCEAYGWPDFIAEHSCNNGMGLRQQLPWEQRGIVVNAYNPDARDDWKSNWDIQPEQLDVVQAAADYYLLEAMSAGLVGTTDGKGSVVLAGVNVSTTFALIRNEAQAMFDALVAKWDPILQSYTHMACGGELRHHNSVGGAVLNGDRDVAWNGWKLIYEAVGPDALTDAAALFREFGGGSFGGEPWAQACEILHARVTGKIAPRLFLDRIFNAQHNGGVLLNKVNWKGEAQRYVTGKYDWSINELQSRLLPAHGAEPEPDYPMLLAYASPEVRQLFNDCFEFAGHAAKELGLSLSNRRTKPGVGCTQQGEYLKRQQEYAAKQAKFNALPKWAQYVHKAGEYDEVLADYAKYARDEAKQQARMQEKADAGQLPPYLMCHWHDPKDGVPCSCHWQSTYYAKLLRSYKQQQSSMYQKAADFALIAFGYMEVNTYGGVVKQYAPPKVGVLPSW